jgi:TPR repeat protein
MPPRRNENAARIAEDTFLRGVRLYAGDGVAKNLGEAARLLRLVADQGHAGAQGLLGACYCEGEGLLRDYGEAARLFRLSADQGDPSSQLALGRMLVGDIPVDERVPADLRAVRGARVRCRSSRQGRGA